MIDQVFINIGQTLTVAQAYSALMGLNPTDPFRSHKAADALGGASRSGFITYSYVNSTGYWISTR